MIKLRIKNKWVDFCSATLAGTDNQCSRQLEFTLPSNPYDKNFKNISVSLGDLVYFYDGTTQLFLGTVTSREKTGDIGTISYTASDFMQHLLRSTATYKFKNTTPEKIVKKVCSDLGIKVGKLAKSNTKIEKLYFDEQPIYDIIISAYRKAKANTGKKYMPIMEKNKVSVIEKGAFSGVVLKEGISVTAANYSENTDNMVNRVNIYNDALKKIGKVENKSSIEKYGVFETAYKKEKDVDASRAAKSLLEGLDRSASIEALGNINAISGRSIKIKNSAAGLNGTFYISSDSHTFENGTHMMSLELNFDNEMEQGAEIASQGNKKELKNSAKCYYLEGSSVYHSSEKCKACKGKKLNKSTVEKIKTIKIKVGKNKGKRKFKPCSKCWIK